MTTRCGTALLLAMADTGFKIAFNTTGVIKVYTGAQPATADTLPSGTLLGTLTLSATAFSAASGTSPTTCKSVAASITDDSSADASGTAGWARMQLSGDAGTTNVTDKRLDMACGQGSGELSFDNSVIVAGGVVHCTSFELDYAA